jgi:hypothetical protein
MTKMEKEFERRTGERARNWRQKKAKEHNAVYVHWLENKIANFYKKGK